MKREKQATAACTKRLANVRSLSAGNKSHWKWPPRAQSSFHFDYLNACISNRTRVGKSKSLLVSCVLCLVSWVLSCFFASVCCSFFLLNRYFLWLDWFLDFLISAGGGREGYGCGCEDFFLFYSILFFGSFFWVSGFSLLWFNLLCFSFLYFTLLFYALLYFSIL